MPLRFQDKHVIVTGGARSIGFEIARQFATEGAVVSIFDCDRDSLDNADRQLRDAGHRVHPFVVDVSVRQQVCDAVTRAEKIAPVDVLVNNAGICLVTPFLNIEAPSHPGERRLPRLCANRDQPESGRRRVRGSVRPAVHPRRSRRQSDRRCAAASLPRQRRRAVHHRPNVRHRRRATRRPEAGRGSARYHPALAERSTLVCVVSPHTGRAMKCTFW